MIMRTSTSWSNISGTGASSIGTSTKVSIICTRCAAVSALAAPAAHPDRVAAPADVFLIDAGSTYALAVCGPRGGFVRF